MNGVYVTGTDTGIGKTRVAGALVRGLRGRGLRVAAMKPLAAGAEATAAGLRNEDTEALLAACLPGLSREHVTPYCLPDPTAPEIAARRAGVQVQLPVLVAAFQRLREAHDAVVVEGVGGWEAPLSATLLQADLCRALELPALLVVGMRLGCINHARLSLRAVQHDGVPCLGWIGSAVDPDFAFLEDTLQILARDLAVPCLGILPHAPAATADSLAHHLAIDRLAHAAHLPHPSPQA